MPMLAGLRERLPSHCSGRIRNSLCEEMRQKGATLTSLCVTPEEIRSLGSLSGVERSEQPAACLSDKVELTGK